MATAKGKPVKLKLESGTTDTLAFTFKLNYSGASKYKSNIEDYTVQWQYTISNISKYYEGASSTVAKSSMADSYTIPSNATKVRVRAKPNRKSGKKQPSCSYGAWKTYNVKKQNPDALDPPDIEIDELKITVSVDDVDMSDTNAPTKIRFQIANVTAGSTAKETTVSLTKSQQDGGYVGRASYTFTGSTGTRYKARVKAVDAQGQESAKWSDYTDEVLTPPSPPTGLSATAGSETAVVLSWTKSSTADHYTIEYVSSENVIGNNISFDTNSVESVDTSSDVGSYTLTGLESGATYYFRIAAVDEEGQTSDYYPSSNYPSCTLGTAPSVPTTWSSTTTAMVGETVRLYWVHNSEDGSDQTKAELELIVGTSTSVVSLSSSTLEYTDSSKTTAYYDVPTSGYSTGTSIKWRVRTWGVLTGDDDVSPWSIQRTIEVYAQPTLEVSILDSEKNGIDGDLESFPFYISLSAGPNTQTPIGYEVDILAQSAYETLDRLGEETQVYVGDSVYSGYYSLSDYTPSIEMTPDLVDLEPGASYLVSCRLSMDSGLTAEAEAPFTVSWEDEEYDMELDFEYVPDGYYALLLPYCFETETLYHVVSFSHTDSVIEADYYDDTGTVVDIVSGTIVDDAYTAENEDVYYGLDSDGNQVYYCEADGDQTIVDGVTLAVYRREFDGSYTEVQSGIANTGVSYIVDPHPALDYARYRVVAVSDSTGAISYYDSPAEETGETSAIIQWDEDWVATVDIDDENENSDLDESPYAANVLVLPYNIDVSDNNDLDVEFVDYIGRKRPVSYYGTHVNETSTWKADIPKYDTDTLGAIRNLAVWMGDCYVREPSGSGYHANVQVSYDVTHKELVIPVTLDITRVEGGE